MILKSERIIQHIISIKYNIIINHMMVLSLKIKNLIKN